MINCPEETARWLQTEKEESKRFISLVFPPSLLRQLDYPPSPSHSAQTDLIETAEKSVQTDGLIKIPMPTRYKGVSCRICERIFVSQGQYEMHLQYNSSYQCCICKKQFSKVTSVKRHGKVHGALWGKGGKFPTKSFAKVKRKREEVQMECLPLQLMCKKPDKKSKENVVKNSVRGIGRHLKKLLKKP